MSDYWFSSARVNDLLRIFGPYGSFYLKPNKTSTLLFLATGTGIAPIKSILEEMNQQKRRYSKEKVYLLWGNRSSKNIYWKPKFEFLDVSVFNILSKKDPKWTGHLGYVQDYIEKLNLDINNLNVYACGSINMIRDSKKRFIDLGLLENKFHSDAFVASD